MACENDVLVRYEFEGNLGDSCGFYNGIGYGGISYESGIYGYCVRLTNDYIKIPDFIFSDNFSISFWFNVEAQASTNQFLYGMSTYNTNNSFALRINSDSLDLSFIINGNANVVDTILENTWYHVVITSDGNFYLDSVLVDTIPEIWNREDGAIGCIGARGDGSNSNFDGFIDEFYFIDKIVNQEEVIELYNNTYLPPGEQIKYIKDIFEDNSCVYFYPFDVSYNEYEGNGNFTHVGPDEIGFTDDAVSGNALYFEDMSTEYNYIEMVPNLIDQNIGMSLSFFLKITTQTQNTSKRFFIFDANVYKINFEINLFNNEFQIDIDGERIYIPFNRQVYYHFVISAASNFVYVYLNREQVGYVPIGSDSLGYDFSIYDTYGSYDLVKTNLDHLRIFNRRLSDIEIEKLYFEFQEPLLIGDTPPDNIYAGTEIVQKIYAGSEIVWENELYKSI